MVESKESLQGKKQGRKKGRRREKRCPSSDRSVERRYALLNGSCRIQEQRESWQGFSNDSTAFVGVSKGTIRNLSERLIQGKNTEGDARRFASVPRLIKVGKEVFGAVRYDSRFFLSDRIEICANPRDDSISRFRECISVGEDLLANESNVSSGIREKH